MSYVVFVHYFILTILLNPVTVSSQTYSDAFTLREALLTGYHSDVRPLNNQADALQINLTMMLYGLPEIDGVKGVIKLVAAIQTVWMDDRITWNPSDYGGISQIPILMGEVWTPSVTLATPAKFDMLGSSRFHVTFFSNGSAFYFPGAVLESTCRFNMKFWPFDKQVCDVGFVQLDYGTDKIVFTVPPNGVVTQFYSPNEEWTLEETDYYTGVNTGFSVVYFRLKFKRQSLFYILTIILPINGIIGLASLVFFLPSESGERVSFAVTIMLSLAVFLMVVSEELPKTSEPISLMCCFILAGMAVSILSTVAAILNLGIYHRNEVIPKSAWHTSLVRFPRCRVNRVKAERVVEEAGEKNYMKVFKEKKATKQHQISHNTSKFSGIRGSRDTISDVITWREVSYAIDTLVFYTIIVVGYVPSVCFLIYLGTATDYQV